MFVQPLDGYQVFTCGADIKCLERSFHPRVLSSDAGIQFSKFPLSQDKQHQTQETFFCGKLGNALSSATVAKAEEDLQFLQS